MRSTNTKKSNFEKSFVPTEHARIEAQHFLSRIRAGKADIPEEVKGLLVGALTPFAEGHIVQIGDKTEEANRALTTQEAADFLQISRKHLIKLLDEAKIPFYKLGKHRRIYQSDVDIFKLSLDKQRLKYLEEMTAIAQEAEEPSEP